MDQRTFSPAEKEAWQKRQHNIRHQREEECARRYEAAAKQAQGVLDASFPCASEHTYLQRKGVPVLGDMRQTRSGLLIIPVRDISGTLQSLQYIAPDGTKRFLTGGKVQGGHFIIPGKSEKPLVLCEGW